MDVATVRNNFPILHQAVNGKPLIYFDNAATSQKPTVVIDAISDYYKRYNSNIHRGAHHLANVATEAYEQSRDFIATYINAATSAEINFVRGTTEAVNLVAAGMAKELKPGDEILISTLEHHSNIVPWQMACEASGATLKVIPINDAGELLMEEYEKLLTEYVKVVSCTYVSNALGTINPIKEIVAKAHAIGAKVFVDAAQAAPHKKIDVQDIDCDWLAFSGHKVFGPTGIGILYGKTEVMNALAPYMGGGEMIDTVTFEKTTYNRLPYKFEAGTPHIEGGIVLAEALKYMQNVGLDNIQQQENLLLAHGTKLLSAIDGMRFIGTAKNKCSVISFLVDGCHPFDIGTMLDANGIAIRTGHHCCQPLMQRLNIDGTCRASFAFYNTTEEIDVFVDTLKKVVARLR
ncbi:MAG: cysteine desulfurase [Chitinophagales bacterium]|nr:cysteine desulfurase [Chitinophagales bacterium]